MGPLSTILAWMYSFTIAISAMPHAGYVWCEQPDGTARVEAATTDGRCLHAGARRTPARRVEKLSNPLSATISGSCTDVSLTDGAVLLSRNELEKACPRPFPIYLKPSPAGAISVLRQVSPQRSIHRPSAPNALRRTHEAVVLII
jgi:hypothetical protein